MRWQQVRCVRPKPESREVEKVYRVVRRTGRQKSKLEPIATIFVARELAVGDGAGPLHQVRSLSGIDERAQVSALWGASIPGVEARAYRHRSGTTGATH